MVPIKHYQILSFASLLIACEQQTHFRSSPLPLFFVGREATTGNASAVLFSYILDMRAQTRTLSRIFFGGVGGAFFADQS